MRYRMLSFWLATLLLGTGSSASGQNSRAVFAGGNASYQAGDFVAAEKAYRRLLEQGIESGPVFYNLGNACFKQGRLGEAIFFWEKARIPLPRDPDVQSNLELAQQLIVDRIEVPEDPAPVRWLFSAIHRQTVAEESNLTLLFFILGNLLMVAYQLAHRRRLARVLLSTAVACGVLVLLAGSSLAWKVFEQEHRRAGIVVEPTVEMRSGPGNEYLTVTTIHEGIKVRIQDEAQGWCRISLPNGWTGWIPVNGLLIL